jgi:glucose/arabinose dehydrogenase
LRVFLVVILVWAFIAINYYSPAYVKASESDNSLPHINDPNFKAELVVKGLKHPTSMAFLGLDDILVLEKDSGKIKRIVNGVMLKEPILDVNVANKNERGMLGIAVAPTQDKNTSTTYVFVYYTESSGGRDGDDSITTGRQPLGNRLYRYELGNNKMLNPKLLLDLPSTPNDFHNGGKIIVGPDQNVYLIIGDGNRNTTAQNLENGSAADGTGGILRITQHGQPVKQKNGALGILDNKFPLNLYYAYGIRNSFGIDFDPVTGKLWDTENGPEYGDEINLVEPGFNSGFKKVQGIWPVYNYTNNKYGIGYLGTDIVQQPNNLVDFNGKGKYSPPEFIWNQSVGVSDIKFFNSDKYGKKYENKVFVGDCYGRLYLFDLNKDRTSLLFHHHPLFDKIANNPKELRDVLFGRGFGGITDLEVGLDGYLYVVSIWEGKIFRIIPKQT